MGEVRVGAGLSQERVTVDAAREATRQAMSQAGLTRAGWSVCFFTPSHLGHADVLRRVVMEESGCLSFSGCSAVGVIGDGQEVEGAPGVAVMVGSSTAFETRSALLGENGEGLRNFARAPTREGGEAVLVALPDSFRVDSRGLTQRAALELPGVPLFGAGSTDDGTLGIALQLGMEGVRAGSISLMGFYGDLKHSVGITQSCEAVGDPRFITQARDNVLIELDGQQALGAFIAQGKALGLESMQDAATQLLFGFPLDAERPEFTGDGCLVRPLTGFDQETHGLVIPHPMRAQNAMGFMHRNASRAEADLGRMIASAGEALGGPPDFGFYFDCSARGRDFYGRAGVDVAAIHGQLGEFPLIGLFGGYELATSRGQTNVYTYTGVLVLMRVK